MSTVRVRIVAVHVACDLCMATARVPLTEDAWSQELPGVAAWFESHRAPRVVTAEARRV